MVGPDDVMRDAIRLQEFWVGISDQKSELEPEVEPGAEEDPYL